MKEKKLSFPTILRATHVFVIDAFHEHELPVCPLGMGLILEGSAQLLDGHISVQDGIVARAADENTTLGITGRVWFFFFLNGQNEFHSNRQNCLTMLNKNQTSILMQFLLLMEAAEIIYTN